MVAPGGDQQPAANGLASISGMATYGSLQNGISQPGQQESVPVLTLTNDNLNIKIVAMNGAIIGRRKGPYTQFFEKQAYVSGVHAQLKYNPGMGWFRLVPFEECLSVTHQPMPGLYFN